jgi:CRP-like cAMP-binding protein
MRRQESRAGYASLTVGQLREGHSKELIQAREVLDFEVALMGCHAAAKGAQRQMRHVDSEPRNASCTAIDEARIAILTRAAIRQLIAEHPAVSAKLLIKITQLLAQRLRNTSAQLVKAVVDRKQMEVFRSEEAIRDT